MSDHENAMKDDGKKNETQRTSTQNKMRRKERNPTKKSNL